MIEDCDEGDMWEMFIQTTRPFDDKFMEFAFLVMEDVRRKLVGFMKGAVYQRILERRAVNLITIM